MWERGSDHAHCERGHAIVYGALVSVIKVRGRFELRLQERLEDDLRVVSGWVWALRSVRPMQGPSTTATMAAATTTRRARADDVIALALL